MTYEERRTWIYAASAVVLPVVYFTWALAQLRTTDAGEIAYVRPMLTAVVGAIVLNIVLTILTGMASPKDIGKKDERDTSIDRYGEYRAGLVLGAAMVLPFGLTLAGVDHFWIAQAIYLAFVLGALTSSILKIVVYRRGF